MRIAPQLFPLGLSTGALLVLALGNILWILAYVAIIRVGFRDRVYGIPVLAICLNVTWEAFFFFNCPLVPACAANDPKCVCPPLDPLSWAILSLWVLLDFIILFQLLRYGRSHQIIPEVRQYFYWIIPGVLCFAFFWHYSYITFYEDVSGIEDAWGINLIMSAMFILMLFLRPKLEGLSFAAAVLKMLGSALNAVGLLLTMPYPFRHHENYNFLYFLFASVFCLDLVYVWLLYTRRTALAGGSVPVSAV